MSTAMVGAGAPRTPRWRRELETYPDAGVRYTSLAIVVLATVVLYYQLYLSGGVAVNILAAYGISFRWLVMLNVVALGAAALAAHLGGLTDRFGRANVVSVGLVVVGLIDAVAIPSAHNRWSFAVAFCLLNAVEGVILVATPALVRDFSPQLGRASAMAFWTMGPVLGSLVVTALVGGGTGSRTWQQHYVIAGVAGLVVAVLSVPLLKELSPALRDQIMVAEKDRALLEARMRGIDVDAALASPTRQMLKPDIVLSSVAISVFLLFYIAMVIFGPTFFETAFGYSQTRANNVLVWAWALNIGGLLFAGWLSDRLLVRKPLMLVGGLATSAAVIAFVVRAGDSSTTYTAFAVMLSLIFFFAGVAYVAWMAAFTETVERRNPALTATGLAVWGVIIRVLFAAFVFIAPSIVNTVSPIVDTGPAVQAIARGQSADLTPAQNAVVAAVAKDPTIATKMQAIAAQYGDQLKTAAVIDRATAAALLLNPSDQAAGAKAVGEIATTLRIPVPEAVARLTALAAVPKDQLVFASTYGPALQTPAVVTKLQYLQAHGPAVEAALKGNPTQWQHYLWIAAGGALVFVPLIWLMAGFWSPRKAREALQAHEREVAAELARI